MPKRNCYPTIEHQRAAERSVAFFLERPEVETVLLTCSCARGKAVRDSCLDLAIQVWPDLRAEDRRELEQAWSHFHRTDPAFAALQQVGRYAFVDLEWFDGRFVPGEHGSTTGPDTFELEIGNLLVYSVPLWVGSARFQQLREAWLPYYDDALRRERLDMVRRYCLNNLDHIPLYVARGLHFQAFDRLYNALGELLQGLFIARRTYPIAYDKWILEQIVEILELPDVCRRLVRVLQIEWLESEELVRQKRELADMLETYCTE